MPLPNHDQTDELLICNDSAAIRAVANSRPKYMFLAKRIDDDADRDPADALRDAELLCSTLAQVHAVLTAPDIRFVLGRRLSEDLAGNDIKQRYIEAQLLRAYNRARLSELAPQPHRARTTLDGRLVPELSHPVTITIKTRCPLKWVFLDKETGESWIHDGTTFQRNPTQSARESGEPK